VPPAVVGFSQTRSGWTLGGGVETALAGNWSAKLEYLYVDLGSTTNPLADRESPQDRPRIGLPRNRD
jgi:opacity protein-like surface antigen